MWKECEFIVKNDSEEFGLFNNRDESTILCEGSVLQTNSLGV